MTLWPRQYAAKIVELNSKKKRREYLENEVPEHLRQITRLHVENHFRKRKIRREI